MAQKLNPNSQLRNRIHRRQRRKQRGKAWSRSRPGENTFPLSPNSEVEMRRPRSAARRSAAFTPRAAPVANPAAEFGLSEARAGSETGAPLRFRGTNHEPSFAATHPSRKSSARRAAKLAHLENPPPRTALRVVNFFPVSVRDLRKTLVLPGLCPVAPRLLKES